MALKINLKPYERLIIDGAVITNGKSKSELVIENNVPVLRDKDILREKDAITPCKRIYFVIQLMYVDGKNLVEKHNLYWTFVRDVVGAAPRTARLLGEISEHILSNRYYPALKLAKKLIEYEKEAISHARTCVQRV
jgi:flagellar protein FlbT